MDAINLIRATLVAAYLLSWTSEWRVHRRNFRHLAAAGADVRSVWLTRSYYALQLLMVPAVLAEQIISREPIDGLQLVAGLTAMLAAYVLRSWAIQSLGPLWTMALVAIRGVRHRAVGPYRLMENPEYISRLIDGLGLGLAFSAKFSSVLFLVIMLVLNRALVSAERAQIIELEAAPAPPVPRPS